MQRLIDANALLEQPLDIVNFPSHEVKEAPTVLTIPENPTNGDIIQKFIPIEDIWRAYSSERGKQVCVRFAHTEYVTCFDADYWDAPYKENTDEVVSQNDNG